MEKSRLIRSFVCGLFVLAAVIIQIYTSNKDIGSPVVLLFCTLVFFSAFGLFYWLDSPDWMTAKPKINEEERKFLDDRSHYKRSVFYDAVRVDNWEFVEARMCDMAHIGFASGLCRKIMGVKHLDYDDLTMLPNSDAPTYLDESEPKKVLANVPVKIGIASTPKMVGSVLELKSAEDPEPRFLAAFRGALANHEDCTFLQYVFHSHRNLTMNQPIDIFGERKRPVFEHDKGIFESFIRAVKEEVGHHDLSSSYYGRTIILMTSTTFNSLSLNQKESCGGSDVALFDHFHSVRFEDGVNTIFRPTLEAYKIRWSYFTIMLVDALYDNEIVFVRNGDAGTEGPIVPSGRAGRFVQVDDVKSAFSTEYDSFKACQYEYIGLTLFYNSFQRYFLDRESAQLMSKRDESRFEKDLGGARTKTDMSIDFLRPANPPKRS